MDGSKAFYSAEEIEQLLLLAEELQNENEQLTMKIGKVEESNRIQQQRYQHSPHRAVSAPAAN